MKTSQKIQFGDIHDMDELAEQVALGTKIATSSLLDCYSSGRKTLSQIGEYASILNSTDDEVAIVRIVKLEIVRFGDISEQFAIDEGDGSLNNWLEIHRAYYLKQLSDIGKELTEDTELICEWFQLI